MQTIRVPSLAENVNQASVGAWQVQEGQIVAAGTDLVELLTEKANFMMSAEAPGTVSAILAKEKSVMPVGAVLCLLDAGAAEIAAAREENRELIRQHLMRSTQALENPFLDSSAAKPAAGITAETVRATPAARRLAKEHGLDLAALARQHGQVDIVREEDVRRWLEKG